MRIIKDVNRKEVNITKFVKMQFEDTYTYVKVKGKALPVQAWTGPEGSNRSSLPDFKTIGT
jgi:hypothetical protein